MIGAPIKDKFPFSCPENKLLFPFTQHLEHFILTEQILLYLAAEIEIPQDFVMWMIRKMYALEFSLASRVAKQAQTVIVQRLVFCCSFLDDIYMEGYFTNV